MSEKLSREVREPFDREPLKREEVRAALDWLARKPPYSPNLMLAIAAAQAWVDSEDALITDDMIERGAKALAYEAGKDITEWDKTPDPFLNPWREKAKIVLEAALGLGHDQ